MIRSIAYLNYKNQHKLVYTTHRVCHEYFKWSTKKLNFKMRTRDNNNSKMTYFQNPDSVKMWVTHSYTIKLIFFVMCRIYCRNGCKKILGNFLGRYFQKLFEWKFETKFEIFWFIKMNLHTQNGQLPPLGTKKHLSRILLYFLKTLHVDIPKS